MSGDPADPSGTPSGSDRTKTTIIEAALETLKSKGYAGASAREIAKTGGFNQALIFYHFGGVQNALLAALDTVSARRMDRYQSALEEAQTLPELTVLAADIYQEDLENGYVTVLAEMVAGAMSDPELGREVVARIEPWLEMVETKVRSLTAGSVFERLVPADDVAFAIVALYLGADMLTHLDPQRSSADSLLENVGRLAPLAQALMPSHRQPASPTLCVTDRGE